MKIKIIVILILTINTLYSNINNEEQIIINGERIEVIAKGTSREIYGGTNSDAKLFTYDIQTKTKTDKGQIISGENEIKCLLVSNDGKVYGGTSPNAYFFIYDPLTGMRINKGIPAKGEKEITGIVQNTDNKIYIGTSPNGYIIVYDPVADTFRNKNKIDNGNPITVMTVGKNGDIYICTSKKGNIIAYNPMLGTKTYKGRIKEDPDINTIIFDKDRLYGGTGLKGLFFIYDLKNNKKTIKKFFESEISLDSLILTSDKRIMGVTKPNGFLFRYNPKTNRIFVKHEIEKDTYTASVLEKDDKFYCGTNDERFIVWDRIPPVFSEFSIEPKYAKAGIVNISFDSDEYLQEIPKVLVNKKEARLRETKGNRYFFEYTVSESDNQGLTEIDISGIDISNNVRNQIIKDAFIIDIIPPNFSKIDINPKMTSKGQVVITFKASEKLKENPVVQINEKYAIFKNTKDNRYIYIYTVNDEDKQGENKIIISGIDFAGNQCYRKEKFYIDTIPPVFSNIITSKTSTGAGPVFISFTTNEKLAARPKVNVNGNQAVFQTVNGNNYTYIYNVTVNDFQGTANITITAGDIMGNTSFNSSGSFVIASISNPFEIKVGSEKIQEKKLVKKPKEETKKVKEKTIVETTQKTEKETKGKIEPEVEPKIVKEKKEQNPEIEKIKKAVKTTPKDCQNYYNLGDMYQKQKQYDLAVNEYKKALELNPNFSEVHINLSIIYDEQEKYDDAIAECELALKNPKYKTPENAYINLGIIYKHKRLIDKSIENFSKALKINPEDIRVILNLAVLHESSNEYEKALELYNKAKKLAPKIKNVKIIMEIIKGAKRCESKIKEEKTN